MHVLVTCKNEDDRFTNEGARALTRFLPFYGDFSDAQGQLTPQSWVQSSRISNSSDIVRDVIDVLVTCKYEEDLMKIKR